MLERQREAIRRRPVPGGGIWDSGPGGDGLATVSHGPYAEQLPVANLAVRQIRERFRDRFDIDPVSRAYVNGRPVDEDAVVRAGELVVFMRPAGEKGARSPFAASPPPSREVRGG
jgi:hypothetical protein